MSSLDTCRNQAPTRAGRRRGRPARRSRRRHPLHRRPQCSRVWCGSVRTRRPGSSAAREVSLILATIEVTDVKALLEEIQGRDVEIAPRLSRQPWGGLDFQTRDPDGNTISSVQYLSS
jgi:Glyoxalase/Bleomycin resistance protein/Dioxygenase superfamily